MQNYNPSTQDNHELEGILSYKAQKEKKKCLLLGEKVC
jgi:hypothetical protein